MYGQYNVIEAKFDDRERKCVIGPLWQYDYGQILKITGIELPDVYEIHFSNDPRGEAKTIIGNSDGAKIPAEYLKTGSNVFAWLYVHQGEDDGSTEYQVEIRVRRRAKPISEEPDEEEQSAISELIGGMTDVLQQTKEERQKAAESAEQAAESVNEAGEFARLAQSYAKGGTGVREDEDIDSAKFYYEEAKELVADAAEEINGVKDTAIDEFKEEARKSAEDAIKEANLRTDETLKFVDGVLSVNRAFSAEQDNTLPITSAAVAESIGNIEVLLRTI